MPGKTIGTGFDRGYAGNRTRSNDDVVLSRPAGEAIPFGFPVVLNADNSVSKFTTAHSADQLAGIAAAEVKQPNSYQDQTDVAYNQGDAVDVIVRGGVNVIVGEGTPTAGGQVYLNTGGSDVAFSAVATGNVELPNVKFATGKMDANKIAEVTILTRNI